MQTFLAPKAWLNQAWASDVLMTISSSGHWQQIDLNADVEAKRKAQRLVGYTLPGVTNAHSHAFQRAMVGMTESASWGLSHTADNFWTWRDQMYRTARCVTPDAVERIATLLYRELLQGGYTHVCEFNYLHNDLDGGPYGDPLTLSMAHMRAAKAVGIGLTMLPTLYMRSGFNSNSLGVDQRRFASTPRSVLDIASKINALNDPLINAGVAIHSLRAVDMEAIIDLTMQAKQMGLPIHIHIAEQMQEVNDCLAQQKQRPIEYLLNRVAVDSYWNLVHATHATKDEISGIKAAGASIVICPSTEANLGDGIIDLPTILQTKTHWSIGSDSHVSRAWVDELRLLEYSQRLQLRERNVSARHGILSTPPQTLKTASCGAALLTGALGGASMASGRNVGAMAIGRRADFSQWAVQQAPNHEGFLQATDDRYVLDQMIFSHPNNRPTDVYVAGKKVI